MPQEDEIIVLDVARLLFELIKERPVLLYKHLVPFLIELPLVHCLEFHYPNQQDH
jgi:hypothetical protein